MTQRAFRRPLSEPAVTVPSRMRAYVSRGRGCASGDRLGRVAAPSCSSARRSDHDGVVVCRVMSNCGAGLRVVAPPRVSEHPRARRGPHSVPF